MVILRGPTYVKYIGLDRYGGTMKRSIAIVAIALTVTAGAFAQTQSLQGFQNAFSGFTGDMAGSLAVNSTIGSNWSDAYVGSFPHFGVGLTAGAAFANPTSATALFDAMGASGLPTAMQKLGVPIPAAVASFKIGLPFLPLDVGIKAGYIPSSVGANLKNATGASVDYSNIGLQVRYALLKQNLLLPNISVGAAYNFQKGSISAPSGLGSENFTLTTDKPGTTTVFSSAPAMALGWTSNTVDFDVQVSKLLLFLVPYIGAGYTVGSSKVTGGVSSTLTSDYAGSYGSGITGLNSYFAALGGPSITNQGFTYSSTVTSPVFRLYGGLSFRIIILDLDTQVMYVPTSKALGASVTARVQL
jgi:hypothetical protein